MFINLFFKILIIVFISSGTFLLAQETVSDSINYGSPKQVSLSGPRIGFTFITGELADTLKSEYDASPFITQFGWQFEKRFIAMENGVCGLTETVLLVGGIEQELFLPSLSFLVGLRTPKGSEIGFGPNLSLTGIAYVFAGGITKRYGNLNFPINLSLVLSKKSTRISLLFGFNMIQ